MKKRIVFLSTHNAACSQMAEAFMRASYSEDYEVFSAGIEPSEVDVRAKTALELAGINTQGLRAKTVAELPQRSFDFVVMLSNKAKQSEFAACHATQTLTWRFPEPTQLDGDAPFSKTLEQIIERIHMFTLVQLKRAEGTSVQAIELFKSLADPTRLAIMMLLEHQHELCVCELMEALQTIQPKISRNLALLKKAGLLADRRQGQWVFYQLSPALPSWVTDIIHMTTQSNLGLIAQPLQLLAQMSERPERCASDVCRRFFE